MRLTIVTSNTHKAAEVAAFFAGVVEVTHVALDLPEHRSDDVGEIAKGKAQYAYEELKTPVMVDDTGLFIDTLNGFPGPYAAFVLNTIGNTGILKLMEGMQDRSARFTTAIGFADETGARIFSGTVEGHITRAPRGSEGFGYDPIFAVGEKTLAELTLDEKNSISHRARALAAFHDWFVHERAGTHGTQTVK